MTSLLPPNATRSERAIGAATAQPVPVPVGDLWNPATCPAALLPWLAWALSVDDWDPVWPEDRKREVIRGSIPLHRIKGTLASVQAALEAMGYGDVRVIEDRALPRLGDDGPLIGGTGWTLGDTWVLGPDDPHWADYWIEVMEPIDRRSAALLAARLASVAPARCRLRSITLAGIYYTLGDDLWPIGDDITLGGIYIPEV